MKRSPTKRHVSSATFTNLADSDPSAAPWKRPRNASAVSVASTSATKICQWLANRFIRRNKPIPPVMGSLAAFFFAPIPCSENFYPSPNE
jgi:hypothetical protein